MGSLKYFISAILFFTISSVAAQYNTGSDDLNKSLVRIDADASVNFGGFKADLSGSYNISENKGAALSCTSPSLSTEEFIIVRPGLKLVLIF